MGKKRRFLSREPEVMKYLAILVTKGVSDPTIRIELEKKFGYKWNLSSIRYNRKKLGFVKGEKKEEDHEAANLGNSPPPNLSRKQRSNWYRRVFKKTHFFTALRTQFEPSEVDIYIEEYGDVCCQFEDIVTTEFMQVDDFLKHRLLINRELGTIRSLRSKISDLDAWVRNNAIGESSTRYDKSDFSEKSMQLNDVQKLLGKSNDRYDKLVADREKIARNLNATRKDRAEELRGGGQSFFAILSEIQKDDKARLEHGKFAELTKIAAEDIDTEFRKKSMFPDGTKQSVILDSKTMEMEDEE